MAFNLDKLSQMAKDRSEKEIQEAQYRKKNREWLRMSQDIALALNYYLRKMNMTQKGLAEKMNVSPSYIGRLMKGQENLTLESICAIQSATGITLISIPSPYIYKGKLSVSPIPVFVAEKKSKVYRSKQSVLTAYSPDSGEAA
jgi:transcriptional regulator with XRE-family HTH domain